MPSLKYKGQSSEGSLDEGHARALGQMFDTEGWKVFLRRLAIDAKFLEDHLFTGSLDGNSLNHARATGELKQIRQIQGMEVEVLEAMKKIQEKNA